MFILAVAITLVYVYLWHKHVDIYITLIYVFILIQNLGYVLMGYSSGLDEAIVALKVIYIGSCFNVVWIMFSVFDLCGIKMNKLLRIVFLIIPALIYACVLTIGHSDLYYEEFDFKMYRGAGMIEKFKYGPLHILFYIMVILYFCITFSVLIYCYMKKKNVSRKMSYLLGLSEFICFAMFFGGRMITDDVELIPLGNVICITLYLFIIHRLCLYNIIDSSIDSIMEKGNIGFISFDFKYNYLGCNETAEKIFPELKQLTVDKSIRSDKTMNKFAVKWLDRFKEDNTKDKFHFEKNNRVYLIDINYLIDGRHKRGYQFVITDDTKDQKYINLMNKFNSSLKEQVARKTNHIVEMHNNLIMSMATMVESRDNSTGGHIKRTSEGVKILIEEIKANNIFNLSEDFCKNIVKAAPMHDLGKIAIDDVILRKPGRFEPEEFEMMKKHAPEGARIVREILKSTDDADFRIVAENVAHYHHERWDGSGYPKGLKGEMIPIEARIMAIADVYDALVSKRVYKDSMSFEKADSIIMEGMGTQFDKKLEQFYVAARPKLEKYYSEVDH